MTSTDDDVGTARKRRRSPRPKPLAPLGERGRTTWDKVTAVHEDGTPVYVLRPDDLVSLEVGARLLDRADALLAGVDLAHPLVTGSQGQPVLHPSIGEARACEAEAGRMLARLRLPDADAGAGGMTLREHQAAAARARWHGTPSD